MSLLSKPPTTINRRLSLVMVPPFIRLSLVRSDLVDGRFTITYKLFDPGGGERYSVEFKVNEIIVYPDGEEQKIIMYFLGFLSFNFCEFGSSSCNSPIKVEATATSSSLGNEITIVIRYHEVLLISTSGFEFEAFIKCDLLLFNHCNWDMIFIPYLDYIGNMINTIISIIKFWILDIPRLIGTNGILLKQGILCYLLNPCFNIDWFDLGFPLMIHIDCYPMILNITDYLLAGSLFHELSIDFIGVELEISSAVHWIKFVVHMLSVCGVFCAAHDLRACYTVIEDVQKIPLVRLTHDPGGATYSRSYYGVPSEVVVFNKFLLVLNFFHFELFSHLLVLVVIQYDFSNHGDSFSSLLLGILAIRVRLPLQESPCVLSIASLPISAICLGYKVAIIVASLARDAIFRAAPSLIVGCLPVFPSWLLVFWWILIVLVESVYVCYSGLVGD